MDVTSHPAYEVANTSSHATPMTSTPYHAYTLSVVENIERYYMWVILAIGFPGNLGSIVTIMKLSKWRSSTFYVAALATIDNVCLVLKTAYMELKYEPDVFSSPGCSFMNYFGLTIAAFSNWVLVLMATERYLAVRLPLKVGSIWTLKRAIFLTTFIFIVLSSLHVHLFWTVGSAKYGCAYVQQYTHFTSDYWFWISSSVYAFIPCVVLILFNVLIVVRIQQSSKLRRRLTFERINSSKEKRPAQISNDTHITIMLVSVTIVFVILTIPRCIIMLVIVGNPSLDAVGSAKMKIFDVITSILADSNHAVNFYLYFIAARQFRFHFLNLVLRQRRRSSLYSQTIRRTTSLKDDDRPITLS